MRNQITDEVRETIDGIARQASVPAAWRGTIDRVKDEVVAVVNRHLDALRTTLWDGAMEMDGHEDEVTDLFATTILDYAPPEEERDEDMPSAAEVSPSEFNALRTRVDSLTRFARANGYRD